MPKKTKKRGKPALKPKVTDNVATTNGSAATRNDVEQYIDSPVKSDLDINNYRVIKLTNGLTAVLVSGPEIDYSRLNYSLVKNKAINYDDYEGTPCDMENPGWFDRMMNQKLTVSKEAYFELCVNVGSYNDPLHVPGASRLLNKIILKRSKKYPEQVDDFGMWLWEMDGYNHVDGDGETTVYAFDVQLMYLNEALDRFSQSLISPLFSPIDMARLRVDLLSEHESFLRDEEKMKETAKQHLFKYLSVPKHYARVYGSTYLKGLSLPNDDKVYKEVIKFRERHYSAHRMTVVLKADLPLERLEAYVRKYFSKVPNNGLPLREFTQYNFINSFDESKWPGIYKLSSCKPSILARFNPEDYESLSVNETPKRIELTWSMPPSQWLYRTKPDRYLAWLITHGGKGSLISYLRRKKLCTLISSGKGDKEFADNSIYTLFSVSLTLTDEGRKDYKKVLDATFAYINFLRREGPQPKIYDEIRQIEESKFRYGRYSDGFETDDDNVKRLSVNMHLYPPADYLTGKHLFFEYDPVSITTYVNLMSPERTNIILYEKDSQPTHAEFSSDKIPADWLESWKNAEPLFDFKLPEPNAFRATEFDLVNVDEKTPRKPTKIHADSLSEIWYGVGTQFRSPMCYVNMFFISPRSLSSPQNAVMAHVFAKLLGRMTHEELYPAKAAGTIIKFYSQRDEGIELQITGFNQKLPLLMESIAKLVGNCWNLLTNDIFEATRKTVLAAYEERILDEDVHDFIQDLRLSVLKVVHWTWMDKHAALSDLKFPQFRQFVKQFTDRVYVKCLVQGNINGADALTNVQKFMKISKCGPLCPLARPEMRMHEIPTGMYYCRVESFVPRGKKVAVKNYYQCGGYSIRAIVMVDLLTSIIEDDAFEELRLVKNIDGFDYGTSMWMHDEGVVGYTIDASDDNGSFHEMNTTNLDMKIEHLRRSLHSLFVEMTDNEWLGVMKIFMDQKKLPAGSMKLEYEQSRNWHEIIGGTYVFDDPEQQLIALTKLKVEDVRKWMAYLTTSGNNLRKLSIQVARNRSAKPEVASARKYRLKYLPVALPTGMKTKRHHYINSIPAFKPTLKVLPIPGKA